MLARSERVRPCSALLCFSSSGRVTTRFFLSSSSLTVMAGWTLSSSLPLGPSTLTRWSLTETLTPLATGTGFLPILLMTSPSSAVRRARCARGSTVLAYGAEEFAADLFLARLAVAHDALGRADDADAHAVQDA